MRIGIDVDGTLTNLVDRVISYGQEYEIENNLDAGVKNPLTDYYENAFEWGSEVGKKFWRDNLKIISNTSPRPLCKKYLDLLKKKGFEIYIVTARKDEEFNGDAKSFTVKWLKKHKLPFDKVLTNCSNKGQVCKENNIDFFLDDLPFNCDSTASAGVKTFMMYNIMSENYSNKDVTKVYSFVDFYSNIIKLTEGEPKFRTYIFTIDKKPYKRIKKGLKTVDFRINDLRKNKIKVHDRVIFRENQNSKKEIYGEVVETKTAKTFADIIKYFGKENCGFQNKTIEEADKIMHRFYSEEEIKNNGVVGIRFKINE